MSWEILKKVESFLLVLGFTETCFYKYSVQLDVTSSGSKYNYLIKPYALVTPVEVPGYSEDFSARKEHYIVQSKLLHYTDHHISPTHLILFGFVWLKNRNLGKIRGEGSSHLGKWFSHGGPQSYWYHSGK